MFRAVRIHERVCPGEHHVHTSAIVFNEIETEEFAAFEIERCVAECFAQTGLFTVKPHGWNGCFGAREFPFRVEPTAGTGAQEGMAID